jgi:hypothetical protein
VWGIGPFLAQTAAEEPGDEADCGQIQPSGVVPLEAGVLDGARGPWTVRDQAEGVEKEVH